MRSPYPNELMHYGVLGMKWGVRRYQNPDGTLTEAGKARYGGGISKDDSLLEQEMAKKEKKGYRKYAKTKKKHDRYERTMKKAESRLEKLSQAADRFYSLPVGEQHAVI